MATIFKITPDATVSLRAECAPAPEGYKLIAWGGFEYAPHAIAVKCGEIIAHAYARDSTWRGDPCRGIAVLDPLPEGVSVHLVPWVVEATHTHGVNVFETFPSWFIGRRWDEQLPDYIGEMESAIERCGLTEKGEPQIFAALRKARKILAERQFRQRQERRDSARAYLSENGVEIPDRPSKEMWWNIHFLLNGGGLPALLQLFSHKGEVVSPQGKAAWDQYYGPESKGVSFPRRESAIRLWEMLTGKKARVAKVRMPRPTVQITVGNADEFGRIEF